MFSKIARRGALLLCTLLVLMVTAGMASAEEEKKTVEVFTVDEFLDAIAPDTEIVLATGEYNLAKASSYSRGGGAYYHWEGGYDGYELVITDVENLSIVGGDPMAVTISTEPRYANVLRFDNVRGVTISDMVIGHTRERGACIGGVLLFENSRDVEILSSRLYGCGTLGVSLNNCRDVHVDGSDIYDCSYGCVEISGSENVLFENSKFYDCEIVLEGFAIRGSQNVAFINSEICKNTATSEFGELFVSDSPDVYLGGLDIHDNGVGAIFSSTSIPMTVETCRIDDGSKFVSGKLPVGPDGSELTIPDLQAMKMRPVTWKPAEIPEAPRVEAGEDGKIRVTTVDEFLAAIGNNAVIHLEPGEYDLTAASNYGGLGGEYYRWQEVFDGYELIISGVNNLTIEAESGDKVSILTQPRYANVLNFSGITGLTVRNLKIGHTIAQGSCTGGVVNLEYVNSMVVEGCDLFGCGTIGVQAYFCNNLRVYNCEIHDCSYNALWLANCQTVRVEQCDIHDNGEESNSDIIYVGSSEDVLVNGQPPVSNENR